MIKTTWWLMLLLSIAIAGYAIIVYGMIPLGEAVHPDMKVVFERNANAVYSHVFASSIALALGPFQFSNKLRAKYTTLHRWMGRAYLLVGVLLGGLAGLYIAQFSYGGIISIVGFSGLAIVWLFTGVMAFYSIWYRDIVTHRKWMVRNFALTFAAVTLRVYMGLFLASGMEFEEFYPLLAWLCWVPNILIAEWMFNTRSRLLQQEN